MNPSTSSGSNSPNDAVRSRARELEERAEKQAATEAIDQILQKHLGLIEKTRAEHPVNGVDLLSFDNYSSWSIWPFSKAIPAEIGTRIGRLHEKIKSVIADVAQKIENGEYQSSEEAMSSMELSYNERSNAKALLKADKDRLVSYQALNTTVAVFSELNALIQNRIEQSERANDTTQQKKLLFGNAILVYELTDFVIRYVEAFEVQGLDEIAKLHADSKRRNGAIKADLAKTRTEAHGKEVAPDVSKRVLNNIALQENALERVNSEWDKYVQQNQNLQNQSSLVFAHLPTLKVIRLSAKNQIQVLEAIQVLQILKDSLGELDQACKTLEGMELTSLSPERVSRLLGLSHPTA